MVKSVLDGKALLVHAIEGRAKDPKSLRRKVFKKKYKNPKGEITDLIGIRVILFYDEDVSKVASALSAELAIIKHQSADKSLLLGTEEFGYRSVHLFCYTTTFVHNKAAVTFVDRGLEVQMVRFVVTGKLRTLRRSS